MNAESRIERGFIDDIGRACSPLLFVLLAFLLLESMKSPLEHFSPSRRQKRKYFKRSPYIKDARHECKRRAICGGAEAKAHILLMT